MSVIDARHLPLLSAQTSRRGFFLTGLAASLALAVQPTLAEVKEEHQKWKSRLARTAKS
jgi:hypothetical protein